MTKQFRAIRPIDVGFYALVVVLGAIVIGITSAPVNRADLQNVVTSRLRSNGNPIAGFAAYAFAFVKTISIERVDACAANNPRTR